MKNHMALPWVEKYRPKSRHDLIGNTDSINSLHVFLKNWKKGSTKPGLILLGPPGSGKTSSIYALANELDYEIIEVNASDARNKKNIFESLDFVSRSTNYFDPKPRIILMEEIDGMAGNKDRGGIKEFISIIKTSNHPIICTANNEESKQVETVSKVLRMIKFVRVDELDILEILESIAEKENLLISDEELETLSENALGDIRASINELESFSFGNSNILEKRNKDLRLVEILNNVFSSKTKREASQALNKAPSNYTYLLSHFFDQAYRQCKTPDELVQCYQQIANADLVHKRIIFKQDWRLLKYFFEFLGPGMVISRPNNSFVKIVSLPPYPQASKMIGMGNRKRKSLFTIAPPFSKKLHMSINNFVYKESSLILSILRGPDGAEIAASLDLSDEILKIIAGKNKNSQLLSKIEEARRKVHGSRINIIELEDDVFNEYLEEEILNVEEVNEDTLDDEGAPTQTSLDDFF